jgi:putative DNA primase/helicase
MALKLIKAAPEQDAAFKDAHLDGGPGDGDSGCFGPDGRRIIQHDAGQLPRILDELGAALGEFCRDGGNLFRWGAGLSRVYVAAEDSEDGHKIKRHAGAVSLVAVGAPHLCELAGRAASHEKYDGRAEKYKACDCPAKTAEAYMARGFWPEIPLLNGFVECPTLTLDGRVLDVPGYDAATGLFAAWSDLPGFVSPPRAPSLRDAADAADELAKAIDTFPFVSPADISAALAGMILAVCRRSLPSAPMLAITAPTPGTGKSLLADTISLLATGRRASVMSLGHDDNEAEKRIDGILLAGDPILNIDNVERPLGGDLLNQILSQPVKKVRPLGGSGIVDVPTCAIIAATGNNLSIDGDLKRRVTMIRLDAKLERPELRAFDGEPHLDRIARLRGKLVAAALTIPLAYMAAGSPKSDAPALGGFEDWDRICRQPLRWIGLADPLEASSQLRAEDPDLEALLALLTAWFDLYEGSARSAADIIREGMAVGEGMDIGAPTRPELREALLLVSGGRQPTSRSLGSWLRRRKGRVVGGKRFVMLPQDRNGIARWQVATGEAGLAVDDLVEDIDM